MDCYAEALRPLETPFYDLRAAVSAGGAASLPSTAEPRNAIATNNTFVTALTMYRSMDLTQYLARRERTKMEARMTAEVFEPARSCAGPMVPAGPTSVEARANCPQWAARLRRSRA
jgi:hypothetical protein